MCLLLLKVSIWVVAGFFLLGFICLLVFSYLYKINSELAKAKENEILNREFSKRLEEDMRLEKLKQEKLAVNSTIDKELELLIEKKRWEDALEYIEERRRLAFEQGNDAREDMYRRYREHIAFETRDRSQDGF